MLTALGSVPRRIFLDSCTAQTLRDYGGYIYGGEPVAETNRIFRIPEGMEKVDALRQIMLVGERALFEWIISSGSLEEASGKGDSGHMSWIGDVACHSAACLAGESSTAESGALATRLNEPKFGYLSEKDRLLLQHAISLRCDAFLTMERRLPRNAAHIERELGFRILTPVVHWELLRPWAALWR